MTPGRPPKRRLSESDDPAMRQVTFAPISSIRRGLSPHSLESSDSERPHEPELDHPADSVYHAVADRSIFSIAGALDKASGEEAESSPYIVPSDDPVALGLLSMDECESLFGHYFDQLQTCVCLLDPALHTAFYTRRTSLQLFAAVLTVASKFFRPELYEVMLEQANRLVNAAIADCACNIELVQAICLLHYWKKPKDPRGWLRLGHAIRLGYQLDLHLPRKNKLPVDEQDARRVIDRERTWISLFCFDSTMTQLSDRPSMMHKAPDVQKWIQDIPYPLPSDGQLDFAVKTSILSSEVRQLQRCRGSYEVMRSGLRRVLEELHRSHQSLTAEDARVRLTSTSFSINKFSVLATQLLVECTSLSFAPNKHRISLLHKCVSTSLDLLNVVVESFARKGIMPMIEDAHSVAVASTAVRLIRFMTYLDSSARASVMRKLTRESHPAYLARFLHALLDKAHLSRPPSREASPARKMSLTARVSGLGSAPNSTSPLHQKTTPDQWWDEIGQFAYQEPLEPFKEHEDFWDGFPMLAGAMSTLEPVVQAPGTLPPVDQPFGNLPWDAQWDLGFLGIAQNPTS